MKFQRIHTAASNSERAIDVLAQLAPELSKQQLKQAMQKGAVWLKPVGRKSQKRLRRVTQDLKTGDKLALYYDADLLAKTVEPASLVADEKHYSIWNKPAGMLAQGTLYGDHCSLLAFAELHLEPRRKCFLVHRLDSAANGLMLIAHSERAAAEFSKMFQQRQLTKRYRVMVEGLFDASIKTINEVLDDKEAITQIETVTHMPDNRSELVVGIETGRKHQIRRHLAALGHPVIGDAEYGSSFRKEPLQLTAAELSFVCPLTRQQQNYFFTSAAS
jgi:tRNA pseudouridine32 synthase/23S rRNA pseudouridine746 synthase